jgi:hypothetical protein
LAGLFRWRDPARCRKEEDRAPEAIAQTKDTEALRFLMQCQTQGVHLTNCPAYVLQWMARESAVPGDEW